MSRNIADKVVAVNAVVERAFFCQKFQHLGRKVLSPCFVDIVRQQDNALSAGFEIPAVDNVPCVKHVSVGVNRKQPFAADITVAEFCLVLGQQNCLFKRNVRKADFQFQFGNAGIQALFACFAGIIAAFKAAQLFVFGNFAVMPVGKQRRKFVEQRLQVAVAVKFSQNRVAVVKADRRTVHHAVKRNKVVVRFVLRQNQRFHVGIGQKPPVLRADVGITPSQFCCFFGEETGSGFKVNPHPVAHRRRAETVDQRNRVGFLHNAPPVGVVADNPVGINLCHRNVAGKAEQRLQ